MLNLPRNSTTMKIIKLSNSDKVAIINDEDYDKVMSHNTLWCYHPKRIHTWSKLLKRGILLHRVILDFPEAPYVIDHLDRNILNNLRSNLRIVAPWINQVNSRNRFYNNHYRGVTFHKKAKKYYASIQLHNKRKHLGTFTTEVEAAKAYNRKAKELFGEFAVLNTV